MKLDILRTYRLNATNMFESITDLLHEFEEDLYPNVSEISNVIDIYDYCKSKSYFEEGKIYYLLSHGPNQDIRMEQVAYFRDEKTIAKFINSFVYDNIDSPEPIYNPNKNKNIVFSLSYICESVEIYDMLINDRLTKYSSLVEENTDKTTIDIIQKYFPNVSNDNDVKIIDVIKSKLITYLDALDVYLAESMHLPDTYRLYDYFIAGQIVTIQDLGDSRIAEWMYAKSQTGGNNKFSLMVQYFDEHPNHLTMYKRNI